MGTTGSRLLRLNHFLRTHGRLPCAALLALALFVRALVPVGYMPDATQASAGVFALKICSGPGLATIFVDGRLKRVDHAPSAPHAPRHASTSAFCFFNATVGWAGFTAAPLTLVHAGQQTDQDGVRTTTRVARFVFSNASPRSPPRFS
jgi:hypothetical protein